MRGGTLRSSYLLPKGSLWGVSGAASGSPSPADNICDTPRALVPAALRNLPRWRRPPPQRQPDGVPVHAITGKQDGANESAWRIDQGLTGFVPGLIPTEDRPTCQQVISLAPRP
jgi:hypothetical protein